MNRAQQIIETSRRLKGERAQLNQLWEEVASVLSPERQGFVNATVTPQRRTDKIFDTTPIIAKRGLVNSLGAMLRPKSSAPGKWFDIVPEDEDLLDVREVKEWIEYCEERLWRSLYNPKAKFIQATGEVDDDLVTFGTATGFLGLREDQTGFNFRAFHMANVYLETNADNEPNGCFISEFLDCKQAAERYGKENLGNKTLEALSRMSDTKRSSEKFEFIWCVKERSDFDPRSDSNLDMPVMSVVVDVESEHLVLEEGFEEYPFFHPMWDTRSGEVYGRGIGVLCLPDALTLQQMGKTMLRGLHRAVDPPWLLPADGMVNAPQMRPGGVSYYDAKAIRNLGVSDPFRQMESRAQIPWGLNAQQAGREQVMAMFYKNVLDLPIEGPQMTATEVIARRESFVREIGAIFGILESSYSSKIVERGFNIMMRKGVFGTPEQIPEEVQGSNITFRFASPVEKAKRQIEEANVVQGLDRVMAIGNVRPEILDRYNWDEIGKFIAKSNDFPPELTLDDKATNQIKEENAMMAQQQQAMETMQQGAGALGQVPGELLEAAVTPEEDPGAEDLIPV